jgi:hypothetical protein
MTVIAVKGSVMAADSKSYCDGQMYRSPPGRSKISRAPDGSLVGASGSSVDTHALHEWVRAGMNFAEPPSFRYPKMEDDDRITWLWLKPDGSLWHGACDMRCYPVEPPFTIGYSAACSFTDGAMHAGLSAEAAVRLAIEHCSYVGGPVQVERLGGPEPGSIREVSFEEMQRIRLSVTYPTPNLQSRRGWLEG